MNVGHMTLLHDRLTSCRLHALKGVDEAKVHEDSLTVRYRLPCDTQTNAQCDLSSDQIIHLTYLMLQNQIHKSYFLLQHVDPSYLAGLSPDQVSGNLSGLALILPLMNLNPIWTPAPSVLWLVARRHL